MRALALLLLVASACAQELPARRMWTAGETTNYRLQMDLTLFGSPAKYSAKVAEKTAEVTEAGALVEFVQSEYKASLFDEEVIVNDQDLPKTAHLVDAKGEVAQIRGPIATAAAYRFAAMRVVRLPGKAVAVGGTWTVETTADATTGRVAARSDYVFEAVDQGWAKVKIDYKETTGSSPTTATGTVWLDLKTGAVQKLELEFKEAPLPGSPNPVEGKLVYERIP